MFPWWGWYGLKPYSWRDQPHTFWAEGYGPILVASGQTVRFNHDIRPGLSPRRECNEVPLCMNGEWTGLANPGKVTCEITHCRMSAAFMAPIDNSPRSDDLNSEEIRLEED